MGRYQGTSLGDGEIAFVPDKSGVGGEESEGYFMAFSLVAYICCCVAVGMVGVVADALFVTG